MSLFLINKLNQTLVSFAWLRGLIAEEAWVHTFDSREGSRRYEFVAFTKEVCGLFA